MCLETVPRYDAAEDRSEVDAWKVCIKISVGLNVERFPRHKLCFFSDRWSIDHFDDRIRINYLQTQAVVGQSGE